MNKQSNIYFLVIALVIASCGKKEKKSNLLFSNSIESIYCWGIEPTSHIIKSDQAHSGIYMSKIDSIWAYSTGLKIKLKDASKNKLKELRLSAWVMVDDFNAAPELVAELRDHDDKVIDWISKIAINDITEAKTWTKIQSQIDLTIKNRNNPENEIRVYVSNGKSQPAYVDDIEVEFFE